MDNLVNTGVLEADKFRVEEDLGGTVAFLADLYRRGKWSDTGLQGRAGSKLTLILWPSGRA